MTASPRPVPLSVQPDGIPPDLVAADQFVVWKYVGDDKGKWTKPPYIASDPARLASSTDPATWRPYRIAIDTYLDGKCDGIGVPMVDGLAGVDLDHCIDDQGVIAPWAMAIVTAINTYAERSPSGHGLRLLVRGTLPPGRRKAGPVEMYDSGRYLTVTGQHLDGTPTTIEERTAALAVLHAQTFAAKATKPKASSTMPVLSLGDAELLDKARRASNGSKFSALWAGDISGHASHSEADLALCNLLAFWTNWDAGQMDRLFRQSGLMRDKWDTRHGEQAYGDATIEKAISGCRETYSGARPTVVSVDAPMPEPEPEAVPVMPMPYTFAPAVPHDHFISQWIDYASRCTDGAHEYHEAAALGILADATPTVRARLTQYPNGLGTNFYGLLIGDSTSSRKSTSKDLARDVLYRVLPSSLCSDAFSPEGFVEQLAARPRQSTCLFVDEFSELLSKLHHAPHMAGMKGLFLTVYGGGNYSYHKHSKRAKDGTKILDEDHIVDPHLSVLGCTTPAIFESLTEPDVLSGLLPRFAVIMPTSKPARRPFFESDDDLDGARDHLARHVGRLHAWATSLATSRAVRFEPGVLSRLDALFFEPLEQAGAAQTETGRAMLSRLSATALKLCLLVAAGRPDTADHAALVVTTDDAESAMIIARRWQSYALAFAARIGESDFERKLQRVLVVVRQRRSVPRHVLARLAHCDKKTLDSIRDTLVDRGQIVAVQIKADMGRPGELWQVDSGKGGQA
ncbi:MAG: DUF3987 domain-containing protein [Acidobacteria bacterium]|nr:DUF3987 domain-containing protein [Acidobacteriota bacterium]